MFFFNIYNLTFFLFSSCSFLLLPKQTHYNSITGLMFCLAHINQWTVNQLTVVMPFCVLRSGSGHHLCWKGHPRVVAAWCGNALWTFRTASGRKPADASWLPNEQLLSDRTRPQRGQTASRSTSLKPRHGFEVHGFILRSPRTPPPDTSTWRHIQPSSAVSYCHSSSMFSSVAVPWVVSTEPTLSKYFTCRNQTCLQNRTKAFWLIVLPGQLKWCLCYISI